MLSWSPVRHEVMRIIECAPCSLEWALFTKSLPWNDALAEMALDITISSLNFAGASEVVIPFSLAKYLNSSKKFQLKEMQGMMKDLNITILLRSYTDLEFFLSSNDKSSPTFKSIIIPFPSGYISSKILFGAPISFYYKNVVSLINSTLEKKSTGDVAWSAWMRSALSCQFEGSFSTPTRIGDCSTYLLSADCSPDHSIEMQRMGCHSSLFETGSIGSKFCERVIWEENISSCLTPRWMETILKSSSACGTPLSQVALSFCEESPSFPSCWMKGIESSVATYVSSSIPYPMFSHSDSRCNLKQIQELVVGYNETTTESSANEIKDHNQLQLERTKKWMHTLLNVWDEISTNEITSI